MPHKTLGLIETKGMLGAIEITRAASGAAEVEIISAELTESGRVAVKIEGTWDAVVAAVEAGARAAEQADQLIGVHIIPSPDESIGEISPYHLFLNRYLPAGKNVGALPIQPKPKPAPKPIKVPIKKSAPVKHEVVKPPKPKPAPVIVSEVPKPAPNTVEPNHSGTLLPMSELEAMAVVKLRHYARTIPNLPIKGRQISIANKEQLLEAIKTVS